MEVTPDTMTFVYEQSKKLDLVAWELQDPVRCDAAGLIASLVVESGFQTEGQQH